VLAKQAFLPLEQQLQPILLWLFLEMGFLRTLPQLALNQDPSDLSLLSSQDYRHELLLPSSICF
jgi:hypothetical protein